MKTVTVKDLVIGAGAPKIIVSLMAKDIASVKSEALAYREADFDILEWRVDHFADLSSMESVMAAARILREVMPEKPLLFTFRSAKKVTVHANPDMPWTLDGEREQGHETIEVENLHHAIRLMQRKDSHA